MAPFRAPALDHGFQQGLIHPAGAFVLVGRIAEGRVAVAGRGRAAARIGAGDIVGEGTEGEEGEVVADALG